MSKLPYKPMVNRTRKNHNPFVIAELEEDADQDYAIQLTALQERFCQLYVTRDDLTKSECVVKAGYAGENPHGMASRWLRHKALVQRIKQLRRELGEKYEVNFERHISTLAKIRDAAFNAGNYAAAVAAEKHRGQAAGLYVDRKEILHGRLDQMNRDDVMKEIAKLQQEYPALRSLTDQPVIEHMPTEEIDAQTVNGEKDASKAGK